MRLIGIDGGGTKTDAVMFDETGRVLGRRRTGPCNPNLLGLAASAALVKECVDALTRGEPDCARVDADGTKPVPCVDGIYIGTAGIFTKDDGPRFAAAVAEVCGAGRVKCENDVMNVVAAATDADRCVAGVCGTGMIVYAKEPGRVTRLGGWGYLLEHGGSGYAIGRDAMRAALDAEERTGPATALARLVAERAAMPLERLVLEVYRRDPAFVASFAPLVFEADALGDDVARGIIARNVRLFASMLNHAASAYDCGNTVVVSGGIAANGRFGELLAKGLDEGLHLMVPSCPQVVGACINCARFCGLDVQQMRRRFSVAYGGGL